MYDLATQNCQVNTVSPWLLVCKSLLGYRENAWILCQLGPLTMAFSIPKCKIMIGSMEWLESHCEHILLDSTFNTSLHIPSKWVSLRSFIPSSRSTKFVHDY